MAAKYFWEVGADYKTPKLANVDEEYLETYSQKYNVILFDNKADALDYLKRKSEHIVHTHVLNEQERIEQYIWACEINNIKPNVKKFLDEYYGRNDYKSNEIKERDIDQYLFACQMENWIPNIPAFLRQRNSAY